MKERLASLPVIGAALRVHERFGEIRGTAMANGIALQTFLSIFPLLVVGIAVVGFLSNGDPDFADSLVDSLDLEGESADTFTEAVDRAQSSRRAASVVGLGGLLFTGLNLVTAIQRAVDVAWQSFGTGLMEKVRAFLWLGGATLIFVGSFGLGIALRVLPGFLAPVSILAGVGVNVLLFLWTFHELCRVPVGWRAHLPGAVFCAITFEAMKIVGAIYVPMLVANSSALYGSLGVVFAVLAWLAVFGRIIVYGTVLNVVRWEEEHGTVTVPIDAPSVPGSVPVHANRSGAVDDRLEG